MKKQLSLKQLEKAKDIIFAVPIAEGNFLGNAQKPNKIVPILLVTALLLFSALSIYDFMPRFMGIFFISIHIKDS